MSDGLKYIIKYLSKPKATLIENIINADKDHKTIVEIDPQIAAMDRRNAESKYEPIYSQKVAQLRMLML